MKIYVFKTHLFREKGVSREIEVVEGINLYKFAEAIVGAYDFDFDHAFGFFSAISALNVFIHPSYTYNILTFSRI